MIKKLNKGFSIAELLIVMAIISIIAFMGINIGRKNIEKSYNYYFYNTYKSLTLAIADAVSNGVDLTTPPPEGSDDLKPFFKHVSKILGAENSLRIVDGVYQMDCLNGVKYFLAGDDSNDKILHISIRVPYSTHVVNGVSYSHKDVYLLLDFDNLHYGLIPSSQANFANSVSLLDRIDLLPFTVNDNETGKVIREQDCNDNGDCSPIAPKFVNDNARQIGVYSYKDAFCQLYDSLEDYPSPVEGVEFKINCPQSNTQKTTGAIKMLDPLKVF